MTGILKTTVSSLVMAIGLTGLAWSETPKQVEVVGGSLSVNNLPAVQEVAGRVDIGNLADLPHLTVEPGSAPLEVAIGDVVRTRPVHLPTRHGFHLMQVDDATPPQRRSIRTGIVLTDLVVVNLTNTAVCTFILSEVDATTGESQPLMVLRLADRDVRSIHFEAGFFSTLEFDEPNLFVEVRRATLSSDCSVGVTYSGFER
jgi:hypothetical protein